MLQTCAMGFGGVAMQAIAGEKETEFRRSACSQTLPFSRSGEKRDFPLHGRWSFSCGHLRLQTGS